MPSYRGHLAGGMVVYVALLHILRCFQPSMHMIFQGLLLCLLGSLFPDVDVKSKGQKVFYAILLVFLLYCLHQKKIYLFSIVSLLGLLPMLVRHRGLFHRAWFLGLLSFGLFITLHYGYGTYQDLAFCNSLFFLMGSLSHIILDKTLTRVKRYFN